MHTRVYSAELPASCDVCEMRVTRVQNACDTRAFVKLSLVGGVGGDIR